jgi:diguanylate cyclase (GGDEF)-like protein
VTGIAAFAALGIAAAFPLGYLLAAHDRLRGAIEVRAQLFSAQVSDAASQNPELYNSFFGGGGIDLSGLAIAEPDPAITTAPEQRGVFAADGRRLLDVASPVPLEWPTLSVRQPVLQNGHPLGEVEIARSLRAQVVVTGAIAAASLTFGLILLALLRSIPLRLMNEALERAAFLAAHDQLTGLPNRAVLMDRLTQSILVASRRRRRCAVLFLDMDGFKHINDTMGHATGDRLLRLVASTLRQTLRQSDTLARLGGDEFAIILEFVDSLDGAAKVARTLLDAVATIDRIGDREVSVSFSLGIAVFPDHACDADDLLMRADAAMYQAKAEGRPSLAFFDEAIERETQRRSVIRTRLSRALQLNQFVLLYQPKVHLQSGALSGAEALIRWEEAPGQFVAPMDFIPIAEQSGLILAIGEWVLHEACRQIATWRAEGLPPVRVAVNVSVKSLRDPGFVRTLRRALDEYALPYEALELEITETAAMTEPERPLAMLRDIRKLGVRVSIDDFGTGFSSLAYLQTLPVDTIKIDKMFIRDLDSSEDAATLVQAIISLATSLRKHVVAEGVETQAQRAVLLKLGCREAQGYLFSRQGCSTLSDGQDRVSLATPMS